MKKSLCIKEVSKWDNQTKSHAKSHNPTNLHRRIFESDVTMSQRSGQTRFITTRIARQRRGCRWRRWKHGDSGFDTVGDFLRSVVSTTAARIFQFFIVAIETPCWAGRWLAAQNLWILEKEWKKILKNTYCMIMTWWEWFFSHDTLSFKSNIRGHISCSNIIIMGK